MIVESVLSVPAGLKNYTLGWERRKGSWVLELSGSGKVKALEVRFFLLRLVRSIDPVHYCD